MTSPLSTAADRLVAGDATHSPEAIRMMAHEMQRDWGCTYSAAKSAIKRAIKRADGEASTWGGSRGGGRPKKVEEVSE